MFRIRRPIFGVVRAVVWIVRCVSVVPAARRRPKHTGLSRHYGDHVPHVLISAHRCGGAVDRAYDNSPAGVRWAASIGADYVEFDVRRAGDGTLVCSHDPVSDPAEAPALLDD